MDESVGEVLEGPIRVPMLKVQRTMLRDMYHPKVSEMNRTALLRYVWRPFGFGIPRVHYRI